MPLIRIDLFPGRDHDAKMLIATEITRVLEEKAGIPPTSTTIIFNEVSPSDWVVAGVPLATGKQED